MHIAICDDNIADRKHLERLLGRESDKRAGSPDLLYVDSFGDSKALLRSNPTMYDLFFMDLVETPTEADETVAALLAAGIKNPLCMCSSKIDYHTLTDLPDGTLFLEKPYHVDKIEEVLSQAQDWKDHKAKTLEFRSTEGTVYVVREDILYGCIDGENIRVTRADGSSFELIGQPFEFFENFRAYPEFFIDTGKFICNMEHLTSHTLFQLTMDDGKIFKMNPLKGNYFKRCHKFFLHCLAAEQAEAEAEEKR